MQKEENKNIITVLFMGMDKADVNTPRGYGTNGQADCIFLAAIDTSKRELTIIPISRETMVDVNVYTTEGAFGGTRQLQLCLAYAYGNSPQESSGNVMTSVRRLLYGINVSSYLTVDMKGIGVFSEMLGGIELDSIEDIIIEGNAVKTGLLPKESKDKTVVLNNSSLLGTVKYACYQNDLSVYLKNAEYTTLLIEKLPTMPPSKKLLPASGI